MSCVSSESTLTLRLRFRVMSSRRLIGTVGLPATRGQLTAPQRPRRVAPGAPVQPAGRPGHARFRRPAPGTARWTRPASGGRRAGGTQWSRPDGRTGLDLAGTPTDAAAGDRDDHGLVTAVLGSLTS